LKRKVDKKMRKVNMLLTGALALAGVRCFAGDLAIEGNLNVTSNLTSWSLSTAGAAVGLLVVEGETIINGKLSVSGQRVQMGTNATSSHANTFVWSDGTVLASTATNQFSAYALNGFRLMGGPIYGNGYGLTNINPAAAFPSNSITSDKLASGAVTASKLATGSVGSSALAAGAVTATNLAPGSVGTAALTNNSVTSAILAAGSVGTNKAIITEWNTWGNARYMSVTGTPDLVMNPGRIAAGSGMNVTNISSTAYGASQQGYTLGIQAIGPSAYGASQQGYLAANSFATNNGIGSLQLLNLSNAQVAIITGHASIGLGASVVTNDQAIVVGDGLSSHGRGTVTAHGFFGDGSGLTNLNLSVVLPPNSVTADKLADGSVYSSKIQDGSIADVDIAPGAAISQSKIAGLSVLASSVSLHATDVNNPHQVTAAQIGAYTTNQTIAAIASSLSGFNPGSCVLTNHTGGVLINGTITALSFKGDGANITNLNVAVGSIGTNKAAIAEWNSWGDARYLKAGSPSAESVLADGSVPMTGNLQMAGGRMTGLGDAAADADAVNLKTMTNAISQALLNIGPFGDVSMGSFTTY
jgi:hypothetical protein